MKKVIGILLFDSEKASISDYYSLSNNYVKRAAEGGAIPVRLAPIDGRISRKQLELCNGFIVQSGTKMWPCHFRTIHDTVL